MNSQGKEGTYTELEERNPRKEEEKPLVARSEGQVNADTSTVNQGQISELEHHEEGRLEDDFDREFWVAVRENHEQKGKKHSSWIKAMDEVRVGRLIEKWKNNGQLEAEDPLLIILKKWPNSKKYKGKPELLPSLEQQINRFADILLHSEMNHKNRYETFRDKSAKEGRTLLHIVAELNFVSVSRTLVRKCPGLLGLKTKAQLKPEKKRALLPVEIAIMNENDDTAAFLVRQMDHKRVQSLFTWRPAKSPQPAYFSFTEMIEKQTMRKTVVAVLDQTVNPHWPYLPDLKEKYSSEEEKEVVERTWSTIPDDPLNYHFYYHILEGDECGRPPKIEDLEQKREIVNQYFNNNSTSCLSAIAKSQNREALQHPVVRMLIKTKWEAYGHFLLSLQTILYLLFLFALSFALIYGCTRPQATQYTARADTLRATCELFVILMTLIYICDEIIQLIRERKKYFKDVYNLFDWLGILLILVLIPLRYTERDEQWSVAAVGYLANCLRVFKFSCVTRATGLYTKTLASIIMRDITRFIVVFAVVCISFCGAVFLSLRGASVQHLYSGFDQIMLSGARALVEQQPFSDSYSGFKWLPTVLILSYMGTVIVVLLNILIAQMSDTYAQAKRVARLQYDVDRIALINRMETLPFFRLRTRYYKEGDWINEMRLAKDLLEYSEERHPWETVEDKLNSIREMMKKIVKHMRTEDDQPRD